MEEGMRSGEPSGRLVKKKNSSGCLIIRKKGDGMGGVGSSGSRKVFESKKEKKRPRLVISYSESSDELSEPIRRRVVSRTSQVCNGPIGHKRGTVDESEIGRNGDFESKRKRSPLDVFEFDEYDGIDGKKMRKETMAGNEVKGGARRFLGSKPMMARSGGQTEFETRSSSRVMVDKRKHLFFDSTSSLGGRKREIDHMDNNRFEVKRDVARVPDSMSREKFRVPSDEAIRLQGKNGVLKVMINKKKKVGGSLKTYDHQEADKNQKGSGSGDTFKKNILVGPSFYSETKLPEKPGSFVRTEKNQLNLRKSLPTKNGKSSDWESEDSDASLKLGSKNVEARSSMKGVRSEGEITPPSENLPPTRCKEGKVKRGSGTEKQLLREQIRGMLQSAGWTIDYRPRRNRDYLDAVYINPAGTAYWSIIKAYDALQKQFDDEDKDFKSGGDCSPFTPISEEVLGKLTRQTQKKIEREMKKRQRDDRGSKNANEATAKKNSNTKHAIESMGSTGHEETLSSFIKLGGKSLKGRTNENGKSQNSTHYSHETDTVNEGNLTGNFFKGMPKQDRVEKPSSASNSHLLQGRKSRKLGRCTLLVRSKGLNSETNGFVPYTGKRTLLSWLIDSGTVQLSEKVQYMNRRRTRAVLEGWITRDGIHCGCCSKILTVSKFEIHAGSKLRQPFQNIFLESGVSLLQCQIDAWNRQEESKRSGFHSIDTDGDDPNDDTCGICGDGGDLICCDGCPSTFHQSCLDIQMLPPGDWHCPNCTCKFCGIASGSIEKGNDITVCALLTCSLCEKKYHQSCTQDMDVLPVDSSSPPPSFCGLKCRELFENLQKFLGVKHELEAGYSWSLIHQTDADSDTALRGLPQRVECNSKLAVALTVMDECFLPIVDRRSGINLIHNVLYNCGSNFNRLNYSGFYTAILERGDEIISAASVRIHGTQLAEMPFIGTRHIYRRQGMCRRLFCAIESALCSFKVEKLIIPAISELMHTWTVGFGFNSLEESHKQEMRSLNMLVFPGTDMLHKLLLKQGNTEGNITVSTGAKPVELKGKHCIMPEAADKSDMDSSAEHDLRVRDDAGVHHANGMDEKVAVADSGSQGSGVSLNDTSVTSSSLDAPHGLKIPVSSEGNICPLSRSGDNLAESATDMKCLVLSDTHHDDVEMENKPVLDSPVGGDDMKCLVLSDMSHDDVEMENKPLSDSPVRGNVQSLAEDDVFTSEGTICSPSRSGDKLAESATDMKCLVPSDISAEDVEMENRPVLDSPIGGDVQSPAEGDAFASEGTICSPSRSGDKLAESSTDTKCLVPSDTSPDDVEMENRPVLDSPVGGDVQSPAEGDVFAGEGTICSVSQSGDKLAESATDMKCLVPSDTSPDDVEMENRPLSDSPVGGDVQSPAKGDVFASEGTICSVSQSGDKLAESATDTKCLVPSDTSPDDIEMENRPVLDSPVRGDIRSSAAGDMDDAHEGNVNVACAEPVLDSLEEISAQNTTEEINENQNAVSISTSHGTDESVMQFTSDLNHQFPCEMGSKSFVVSEVVSDATHCKETTLHASGDCSGSDVCEMKTESASV